MNLEPWGNAFAAHHPDRPRPYCPRCPGCRRQWTFPELPKLRRVQVVTTLSTVAEHLRCTCGASFPEPSPVVCKCPHCGHMHSAAEFARRRPQEPILAGPEPGVGVPAKGVAQALPALPWREQWATCRCGHLLRADAGWCE